MHYSASASAISYILSTSFEYAFNKGFEYFECDLQLTNDDYMVLFHNATVDSTTNGSGTVNNLFFNKT